ncbi:MAG: hypothetical protein ABEJ75_02840 [Candidatus Nanohaloarchaea archaeon]
MPLELEFSSKAYRDRPHLVFSLWVMGVPLTLQLFSGASITQLASAGAYASALVVFFTAFSGSYFLEEVDEHTPLALVLVVAVSISLVKASTQWLFGDPTLFPSTLGIPSAAASGVTAVLLAYGLEL